MREKREQEFAALSIKAKECLQRPVLDLPRHQLLLRLWHYPSFGCQSSWLLYTPLLRFRQIENPIVARVVWEHTFDAQRFSDPLKGLTHGFSIEPSTSLMKSEVSAEQLESRLTALGEIALPLLIDDDSVGLDGESFGVETFGFKHAISLQWRCERAEWKPLTAWAREVRAFFDQCLGSQPLSTPAI